MNINDDDEDSDDDDYDEYDDDDDDDDDDGDVDGDDGENWRKFEEFGSWLMSPDKLESKYEIVHFHPTTNEIEIINEKNQATVQTIFFILKL